MLFEVLILKNVSCTNTSCFQCLGMAFY